MHTRDCESSDQKRNKALNCCEKSNGNVIVISKCDHLCLQHPFVATFTFQFTIATVMHSKF